MNGAGAAVDHEGKTTHSRSMPHDPFLPCAHRESRRRALPKCSSPWNLRDSRPGASRHPCFLADLALSPAPAGSRQWLLPCGLTPQRCDRAYQALQDHLGAAAVTFQRLAARRLVRLKVGPGAGQVLRDDCRRQPEEWRHSRRRYGAYAEELTLALI